MTQLWEWIVVAVALLAVLGGVLLGLLRTGRRGKGGAPTPRDSDVLPGVGDDATPPRDAPKRSVQDAASVDTLPGPAQERGPDADVDTELDTELGLEAPTPVLERPEAPAGRLRRLRARLARSNTALGKGLLTLLSRGGLDEAAWEEVEDTLIASDLGVEASTELVERLRSRMRVEGATDEATVRAWLREDLLALVNPDLDRSLADSRIDGRPAVMLVVGVNGTGKTTTVGKLARVLVAEDKDVVLGAADTFRAAAADQLETWGSRVGVPTVRSDRDGADPAAVAFDAVKAGAEMEADVVLVDTAGRLHTKVGLMDELGKVKRVIEKQSPIDEVLLVLDATTGQNGLRQAEVFAEVVDVTGIVLTKLDGTAKGGIVVSVQRKLGVPVKLVGLGEGPDDLAPFDPAAFVDAILA